MTQKPSVPKGTRDFSPQEMINRNYLFSIIKQTFIKYGFKQIETPSFENLNTLTGKYGNEGDKLMFKILNSGDYLLKVEAEILNKKKSTELTPYISEKALRYDLTVPFARYVAQHFNELVFPFKRYQIQPVWRADRPQKGRYREFYQCDADIVGSKSLLQEIELIQLYDEVFHNIGLKNVTIKVNNRKILSGIAEIAGIQDKLIEMTVALDKIDKIGEDAVKKEMKEKGIPQKAIDKLKPLFTNFDNNSIKINILHSLLTNNKIGIKGIEELEYIVSTIEKIELKFAKISIDLTLARGLNYYTGTILEVISEDVAIGSIGGGGRYDDLTSVFGLKNLSGVGISFGLERIYLAMQQLNLFPDDSSLTTKILFANYGDKETIYSLKIIKKLRELGISCELYPDSFKMKKQLNYADKNKINFVALCGEEEIRNNSISIKNMATGEQLTYPLTELDVSLFIQNK